MTTFLLPVFFHPWLTPTSRSYRSYCTALHCPSTSPRYLSACLTRPPFDSHISSSPHSLSSPPQIRPRHLTSPDHALIHLLSADALSICRSPSHLFRYRQGAPSRIRISLRHRDPRTSFVFSSSWHTRTPSRWIAPHCPNKIAFPSWITLRLLLHRLLCAAKMSLEPNLNLSFPSLDLPRIQSTASMATWSAIKKTTARRSLEPPFRVLQCFRSTPPT